MLRLRWDRCHRSKRLAAFRVCSLGMALMLAVWAAGCGEDPVSPDPPIESPVATDQLEEDAQKAVFETSGAGFGDALPGLPAELLARFEAGKETFQEIETPDEGLGPVFNEVSCAVCHDQGAIGGAGLNVETRFGRRNGDGTFDPLPQYGGSLLQRQGITYEDCVQPPEEVPAEANVVAGRQVTPLFGLGLLEAVPDYLLRLLADPWDRNRDGISGRLNLVRSPATGRLEIGRFGWKAQVSSVLVFAGDAYLNEMGIANSLFPEDNAPQGGTPICDDGVLAPEEEDEDADANGISDDVEAFTDFMRFLAPPPRAAGAPIFPVLRGAVLFVRTECASCHRPALVTGQVPDAPALSRRAFYPWTDLLLHDMGSLGDGIGQGRASGEEMRTAPLWGLRVSAPYLHDGRAATVSDAIEAHDGEAARSRDLFLRLTPSQRSDLLAFLGFI